MTATTARPRVSDHFDDVLGFRRGTGRSRAPEPDTPEPDGVPEPAPQASAAQGRSVTWYQNGALHRRSGPAPQGMPSTPTMCITTPKFIAPYGEHLATRIRKWV